MTGALLLMGMVLSGTPEICQSAIAKLGPNQVEQRDGAYNRSPEQIWRQYQSELNLRMEAREIPGPEREGIRQTCDAYAVEWLKSHF